MLLKKSDKNQGNAKYRSRYLYCSLCVKEQSNFLSEWQTVGLVKNWRTVWDYGINKALNPCTFNNPL